MNHKLLLFFHRQFVFGKVKIIFKGENFLLLYVKTFIPNFEQFFLTMTTTKTTAIVLRNTFCLVFCLYHPNSFCNVEKRLLLLKNVLCCFPIKGKFTDYALVICVLICFSYLLTKNRSRIFEFNPRHVTVSPVRFCDMGM